MSEIPWHHWAGVALATINSTVGQWVTIVVGLALIFATGHQQAAPRPVEERLRGLENREGERVIERLRSRLFKDKPE